MEGVLCCGLGWVCTNLFSGGRKLAFQYLMPPEQLLIFILQRLKASRELLHQSLRLVMLHRGFFDDES
jgi:hypothetical protein